MISNCHTSVHKKPLRCRKRSKYTCRSSSLKKRAIVCASDCYQTKVRGHTGPVTEPPTKGPLKGLFAYRVVYENETRRHELQNEQHLMTFCLPQFKLPITGQKHHYILGQPRLSIQSLKAKTERSLIQDDSYISSNWTKARSSYRKDVGCTVH